MKELLKKAGAKLVKHSPEILTGLGTVSIVAGVVLACKASTKVDEVIEEAKSGFQKIEKTISDKKFSDKYSEEDALKDRTIYAVNFGKKIIKMYWLPTLLLAGGLTMIIKSNSILRERNTYLMTSLVGLKETFDQYKNRVIEKYGKEAHEELLLEPTGEYFTETQFDEETGKKKKIKHAIYKSYLSEYGFVFNEKCKSYDKHKHYQESFIKLAEDYCNQKLIADGYLYLDTIYDHFGIYDMMDPIEKKKYLALGHTFGWVYRPESDNFSNHIKFSVKEVNLVRDGFDIDEVNEHYPFTTFVLDFEPDGPVNNFI